MADRAAPDRQVASFEALAQRDSTIFVIYKADDPVARND
jgi:hypothetical protein